VFLAVACLALGTAGVAQQPTFTEVGSSAGVNDAGEGLGMAWGDYDSDGNLDPVVTNMSTFCRLFSNNGDSTFTDVAATAGIMVDSQGRGVSWGDCDDDGDLDLYMTIGGAANKLYRNNGDSTFTDVAATAGVDDPGPGTAAAWADYDRDGDLDLYAANGGAANRLYRNNGDRTFTEIGAVAGVNNTGNSVGAAWGDYDGDGDPDLYVTRPSASDPNLLYRNNGDSTFTEVGASAGMDASNFAVGAAWADYDNDGYLDLYVTRSNVSPNLLYRNNGNVNGTFTEVGGLAGVNASTYSHGIAWGDYDNDGALDLYVSVHRAPNLMFRNNGDGTFTEVAAIMGMNDSGGGRGVAWADYDNDGDLDLHLVNDHPDGPIDRLFRNNGTSYRWLVVSLVGTVDNTAGIGARVTAVTSSTRQRRDVDGGSGYYSQPSLPVEFGFGLTTTVDSLIVQWPTGMVQTLTNVATNQILTVTQPQPGQPPEPPLGQMLIQDTFNELPIGSVVPGWLPLQPANDPRTPVVQNTSYHSAPHGASITNDFGAIRPFPHPVGGTVTVDVWMDPKVGDDTNNSLYLLLATGNPIGQNHISTIRKNESDRWFYSAIIEGVLQTVPFTPLDGEGHNVRLRYYTHTGRYDLFFDGNRDGDYVDPEDFRFLDLSIVDEPYVGVPLKGVMFISGRGGAGTTSYFDDLAVYFRHPFVSVPDTAARYLQALDVPVRLGQAEGEGILSAEVFVAYDGDLLLTPAIGLGSLLTADWTVESHVLEGVGTPMDTLKIAMATDDDTLAGSGSLVNLSFQVADVRHPASTPVRLAHVLFNDGIPGNTRDDGSVALVGTDGTIDSAPPLVIPRHPIQVMVNDVDEDRDTLEVDSLWVTVRDSTQIEGLWTRESGAHTGVFTGSIATVFSRAPTSGDRIVQTRARHRIAFSYVDSLTAAGTTVVRTDTTRARGGKDGSVRPTVVVQPGDTLRVRVVDDDLADSVLVGLRNLRTGEAEVVRLGAVSELDSVYHGRGYTESGGGGGPVGDARVRIAKADSVLVSYVDTLTAEGGVDTLRWPVRAVDPFGDVDGNNQVQAYDASRVLFHRLHPYLFGVDSLSANVDLLAPFSQITAYDAALILQKRVGRIARFPVQTPWSANQPQPESSGNPKPVLGERLVEVRQGHGHVGIWMENRSGIVSGELEIEGVRGPVQLGEGLADYLVAWDHSGSRMMVVFAGAESVSGPGELVRLESGVGPAQVRLARVTLNDGLVAVRFDAGAMDPVPRQYVLHGAVPNPFNPSTVIRYELPEASQVRLEMYDALGQLVRSLVAGERVAGAYTVEWDGRDEGGVSVSSGVYLCRLQAGSFTQVQRMVLLK
jgi:hypothetical protein